MADATPGLIARTWGALRRPSLKYSVLTLAVGGFIGGVVFWGGFNTAMEATNTMAFCTSCHEMRDNVYQEYKTTIHATNRTGVQAQCSDCHVPKDWTHKIIRKVQASKEVWGKLTGSIATKEKFEEKRLELAGHEWDRMKASDSRECRNCHGFEAMNPENQRPRARQQHLAAMEAGNTCIDCHKGIAHKNVRSLLTDAQLEELEKPVKEFARTIPAAYKEGLARAEAKEKAAEAKQKADVAAAADALANEKAAAIVAAKLKEIAAKAPTGAGAVAAAKPADAGATVGGKIDWASVEAKSVTLFYPGQASYEWVQNGKDHGGARAFVKGGDRCLTCHEKEAADMGAKIVSGEKAEATPIPGKRGSVPVKLQAAHDGEKVYFRFQFAKAAHTPAPFVDGGKMDPANEVKVSAMFAGAKVERGEQAGCWATCHHDARTMPDAPKPEALASFDKKDMLDLKAGVTKYLSETRTEIDIKGNDGPRGGWSKLKSADEIKALAAGGATMDLVRWRSGAAAERGSIVAQRLMTAGAGVEASGSLDGDTWTVVIARPLKAAAEGEVGIEAGKVYPFNIALHDDFTDARFHHVSLAYRFALDAGEAEIIAVKK
ncbi:MAG: NapC/NirT family cytochrome c [Hyphomicrobiaceae bacterium]|nr:NapC/NirT family cytochrome c [Hyphomicrobiaceae bacterium]